MALQTTIEKLFPCDAHAVEVAMTNFAKMLRGKNGFTLVEVAVSTAALASLVAIFSLLPIYKIRLSNVEVKQKANAIIQDINSQINDQETNTDLKISLKNGVNSQCLSCHNLFIPPGEDPHGGGGEWGEPAPEPTIETIDMTMTESPQRIIREVKPTDINITFNVHIESYNVDTLDKQPAGGDGNRNEIVLSPDSSKTTKINTVVAWEGHRCGFVNQEQLIRNTAIIYKNGDRLTQAKQCTNVESSNRCYCKNHASCSKNSCMCKTTQ